MRTRCWISGCVARLAALKGPRVVATGGATTVRSQRNPWGWCASERDPARGRGNRDGGPVERLVSSAPRGAAPRTTQSHHGFRSLRRPAPVATFRRPCRGENQPAERVPDPASQVVRSRTQGSPKLRGWHGLAYSPGRGAPWVARLRSSGPVLSLGSPRRASQFPTGPLTRRPYNLAGAVQGGEHEARAELPCVAWMTGGR